MSLGFKGCGDQIPTPMPIETGSGGVVPFYITGADPDLGGTANQVVNMAVEAADYVPSALDGNGTFGIIIETAAAIKVQLATGDDFTITAAQADAYLGQVYPALLLKVYKSGTTGTFSTVR